MQAAASTIPDTNADMDTRSSASHATAGTSGRGEADLPFRILPGLFSGISLQVGGQPCKLAQCLARLLLRPVCVSWRQGFLDEVDLRQDTIYLEDNSRAVSESRMTGWQSDIGKHQGQGEAHKGSQTMTISSLISRDNDVHATVFVLFLMWMSEPLLHACRGDIQIQRQGDAPSRAKLDP